MVIVDRKPVDPLRTIGDVCGRCNGSGIIQFYNDAAQCADEAYCPICRGTGQPQYFQTGASYDGMTVRHGGSLPANREYSDGVQITRATGSRTRNR